MNTLIKACCSCLVCLLWENHSTLDPCLMKVLVMNLVLLCFLLDCCTYTYQITFLQIVVIPKHFPLQVNFCFPLHWEKCCIFSHLSTDFYFHHIYANCTDTFFAICCTTVFLANSRTGALNLKKNILLDHYFCKLLQWITLFCCKIVLKSFRSPSSFYQTRVRSLATLISDSLSHSLAPV